MYELSAELEAVVANVGSLSFVAVLLEGAIWVLYSLLLAFMAVAFTASPTRAQALSSNYSYFEYLAAEPSDASVMELPPLDDPATGEPEARAEWAEEEADVGPAPEKEEEALPAPEEKKVEKEPSCEAEEKEEVVADYAKALIPLSMEHCGKTSRITFTPGLRIQPRYIYDAENANNDFLIRRFRLKAKGEVFDIGYYGTELKVDNVGRYEADPKAQVENAWVHFPIFDDDFGFRAGLYDLPFSRDALTSDSRLLFMDRSLIKEALTGLGLADNTIGLMAYGRPREGHIEYAFGLFDNEAFEKVGVAGVRQSDELMPAGRLSLHLLDPNGSYADYQGSYIGEGQMLSVGANAAHLGDAIDGANEFDITAWGTDVFFCSGPYTAQAEFDWFTEAGGGATGDITGDGWYAQAGWLFCCPWELAARYQELNFDGQDRLQWTSIGLNYYFRKHNLKVQTDYTFRQGGVLDEDLFQVQLQLDY